MNPFVPVKNYGQIMRANEGALKELRDIHGFHFIEIPLWLIILLSLILISALAYFIYNKFLKKRNEVILTPLDIAQKALRELDTSMPSKDFYFIYAEVVKDYMEKELSMPLLDKTTEEVKISLQDNEFITTGQLLNLIKTFDRADLAKFAKQEISLDKKAEDVQTAIFTITEINRKILEKKALEEKIKAGDAILDKPEEIKEEALVS